MAQDKAETSKMDWEATEAKKSKLEEKTLNLKSVFVTGANRGLGLEFVRQLVGLRTPPPLVFATYRAEESTDALRTIRENCRATTNVHLLRMDVTIMEQVRQAYEYVERELKDEGLTLLINNAGVAEILYFPQLSENNMLKHFDVNAIGPVMVLQQFLPLLRTSASRMQGELSASRAAVLNICAWGASIEATGNEDTFHLSVGSCKMSKAALNMAMRIAAHQVREDGILVVMMCPGWVKTDMGTERAALTPGESVGRMLATLTNLGAEHQGKFMDNRGTTYAF